MKKTINYEFNSLYQKTIEYLKPRSFSIEQRNENEEDIHTSLQVVNDSKMLEHLAELENALEILRKVEVFNAKFTNNMRMNDFRCSLYQVNLIARDKEQGGSYITISKKKVVEAYWSKSVFRPETLVGDLAMKVQQQYTLLIYQDDLDIRMKTNIGGIYQATGGSLEKVDKSILNLVFNYYEQSHIAEKYPLFEVFSTELLNKEEIEPEVFVLPISIKDIKKYRSKAELFENKFKSEIPEGYDDLKLKTLYAVGSSLRYYDDKEKLFEVARKAERSMFSLSSYAWDRAKSYSKSRRLTKKTVAFAYLSYFIQELKGYAADSMYLSDIISEGKKVDLNDKRIIGDPPF